MPSVIENQVRWTEHPWDRGGHEWSPGGTAAGGEMLWWRELLPRIQSYVPTGSALEIGPGFGRWTQHLLGLSTHLTIVDVTERCIAHCRRRFAAHPHLECWTNDGESLDDIPDGSLDFVFSFDSLVHAEAPVLQKYVTQLARKLKPGGAGFIHHSNLRALAGPDGVIPSWVTRRNWRGESMSARLFRDFCRDAGLRCTTQEIVNWVSRSRRADRHRIPGWGMPLTDAFSTFMRPVADDERSCTRVYVNSAFVEQWRHLIELASVYDHTPDAPTTEARSSAPLESRVRRVLRTEGITGIANRAVTRTQEAAREAVSLAHERMMAHRVRRSDPITGSLGQRRCPDCARALVQQRCKACEVEYI